MKSYVRNRFFRYLARKLVRGTVPLLVLGSGAAFLSGCAQLENLLAGATPIAEVQAEPGNYSEVTVRGEVVNQIGILGRGAYQLRDRSGEIWVVTQAGLPEMGQTIAVAGKAEAGIAIGGQSLGVTLTESERR